MDNKCFTYHLTIRMHHKMVLYLNLFINQELPVWEWDLSVISKYGIKLDFFLLLTLKCSCENIYSAQSSWCGVLSHRHFCLGCSVLVPGTFSSLKLNLDVNSEAWWWCHLVDMYELEKILMNISNLSFLFQNMNTFFIRAKRVHCI